MSAWDDIKSIIGKAAPLIGTAIGGPGIGSAVGGMVASALGVEDDPDRILEALRANPEALTKIKALEQEHQRELRRMVLEAETTRLAQVNKSYRQEIASEDGYVRRARPTFLYVVAFSVLVEVIIALITVVAVPAQLENLGTLYGALATPQSIAAAMCGVYLKKRSDDKAVAAGQQPPVGIGAALLGRLRG